MTVQIRAKRVYDEPADEDGCRVLVDRLWPRGIRRDRAKLDAWLKDLAPTTELRQWFAHEPARFAEFAGRYRQELSERRAAIEELRATVTGDTLTLVYAAADPVHNHAVVLREHLQSTL